MSAAIRREHRAACYQLVDEDRVRVVLHAETRQPVHVKVTVRRRRPPAHVSLKTFGRANGWAKRGGRWVRRAS